MTVFPDFQRGTLIAFLKQNLAPSSTAYTDGLKSSLGCRKPDSSTCLAANRCESRSRKGAKPVVPLADRAIGNLQQWLIGSYHGVSRDQLQAYLDEFVFRHNSRRLPSAAFQTLLGLGTGHKPIAAALERLEAPPLGHALQAAGNEAFSVLCRFPAWPCVLYAGLEAWRSETRLDANAAVN
jgi:transposase-like protein